MEFKRFRKIDGIKTAMSQRTAGMKTGERLERLEVAFLEALEILATHGASAMGKQAFQELQEELTGESPAKKGRY